MFSFLLGFIASCLTATMFATRQMMLGFPSGMFWFILGGYAYTQSTATWDIYYLLFFASMGMGIFSIYAAFALRAKTEELRDGEEYIDEGKDDMRFIDEKGSESGAGGAEPEPTYNRAQRLRDRVKKRREAIRKKEFR